MNNSWAQGTGDAACKQRLLPREGEAPRAGAPTLRVGRVEGATRAPVMERWVRIE
jgi:hypothetical protein